jgi:hypothetical protein
MGGYGITEDCPGYLANKWMDSQLETTYEGPEAVQRRQLTITMTTPLFLAQLRNWIREMRTIASERPGTGACTLATAMTMWMWTLHYTQEGKDADGNKLYTGPRQAVTFALADEIEEYEGFIPGLGSVALDVIGEHGEHPSKAGPCAGCAGSADFLRLQNKLATCLTGSRLARDRAAETVSKVMIPEALDYPA